MDSVSAHYQKGISDLQIHQVELAQQNEELRAIQLDLEESRARFADLYDNAPVGYFSFSPKGLIQTVNLTGSLQLGVEKETLLNKAFSSFMGQDDGDLFYLHLNKIATTGSRQTCSLTLVPEDGRPFYVQLDSTPCLTGPDKKTICLTTVININRLHELEKALKISESRYRSLFETSREGVLIQDAKSGEITEVNPFLLEMLGYSALELIGKNFLQTGCVKDTGSVMAILKKIKGKGGSCRLDLLMETKNGRTINAEITISQCLINTRKMIQFNIRDISRRKLLETLLQPTNKDLDQQVNDPLVELRALNIQLEQLNQKQALKKHREMERALVKALAVIKTLQERLVVDNIYVYQEIKKRHHFNHIIGHSDSLKHALYRVEQVAPADTTVLILGETGTGKDLLAAAIHHLSSRKDRPFITVNCAALPASLLESELFGREKGAFTGAETRQIGRFEIADGSTLCLDEIGELPLEMQAKLLRVIQHGEFERLGSPKTIRVDVRIVATTNRDLEQEIAAGRFRQDLFYRLNVFPITAPPLRQRTEDIPLLVHAFVERYARKMGKQITSIPKVIMRSLQEYSWPGNVRELESIIERAVILCPGPGFQLADNFNLASSTVSRPGGTLKEMERKLIMDALLESEGRIEGKYGAAQRLDIHPSTLRSRMRKLGIVRPGTNTSE